MESEKQTDNKNNKRVVAGLIAGAALGFAIGFLTINSTVSAVLLTIGFGLALAYYYRT